MTTLEEFQREAISHINDHRNDWKVSQMAFVRSLFFRMISERDLIRNKEMVMNDA